MYYLKLAEEFSRYPGGRKQIDGPNSAENFLFLLYEKLNDHSTVFLDLDGTRGYGSCFLHEVFTHLTNDDLEKLIVISQNSMLLEECKEYNPNIKIKHIETQKSLIEKLKSTVEKIRHFFTRKRGIR